MLTGLGFTETEALVYCQLLKVPESTGYGVAQTIGKSQANVYSALSTLSSKGAVMCRAGTAKLYSAVPPDELIPRLQREFERSCRAAATVLNAVRTEPDDAAIYQLCNATQVEDRAAAMCRGARVSIAFELFHGPFEKLKEELGAAVARHVGVAGVTFAPADRIDGATCALSLKGSRTNRWPGDQLTLVTDAREALVALFDHSSGSVREALYTRSGYLACLLHAAVVDATVLNGEGQSILRDSLNKKLFGAIPPGFLDLLEDAERHPKAVA